MSIHRKSRTLHKWLMLFVGLQFIVWSVTGLFMVVMDIDYIHGDSLINNQTKSLVKQDAQKINYSLANLLAQHPQAEGIELSQLFSKPIYRFRVDKKQFMISANSGLPVTPISKEQALLIAKNAYVKSSDDNLVFNIKNVTYIKDNPPYELSARHLPVWRVSLTDFEHSNLYIGVNNGLIVTKRHSLWLAFDWMFSFHVMDYEEEDVSNKLLLIFSILALLGSVFGLILSYFSVIKPLRKKKGAYESH